MGLCDQHARTHLPLRLPSLRVASPSALPSLPFLRVAYASLKEAVAWRLPANLRARVLGAVPLALVRARRLQPPQANAEKKGRGGKGVSTSVVRVFDVCDVCEQMGTLVSCRAASTSSHFL